jgi:hypothetical protein
MQPRLLQAVYACAIHPSGKGSDHYDLKQQKYGQAYDDFHSSLPNRGHPTRFLTLYGRHWNLPLDMPLLQDFTTADLLYS